MTTLTFALSRSLALELKAGDEIVVTHLDHDANIAPWVQIAAERGCKVRWLDFEIEDCTLRLEQLKTLLNDRTKLVAVGYASNAVGTINPVPQIVKMVHDVGALCFVDAVHYSPHGPIDVLALDCDFLVFSAYKMFGPHIGILYGKRHHLDRLTAFKVRPASDEPPGKFETGTQNHEGIAGLLGTLDYLSTLGERFGSELDETLIEKYPDRRFVYQQAMNAIQSYESDLSQILLETLSVIPKVRIWGITDPQRIEQRVPTVSITMDEYHPRRIAATLAEAGIYVWDGNFYALAVTERLGLEASGGLIRIGLVHYNTPQEVEKLGTLLAEL